MRLVFSLLNTGLGNNGGSSTIIKSANKLIELGHDVIILDSGPNKHTWEELKAKHLIFNKSEIPKDIDAIIATGFKSVEPSMKIPSKIKCHWIRAWEDWVFDEEEIISKVLKQNTYKFVNSICLKNRLLKYNVNSEIVRPGYSINELYPIDVPKKDKIIVGGLYREGIHGKRKRTSWIFEAVKNLKKKYDIELWLFGSEKNPNIDILDKYYRKPTIKEKRELMNMVDIWLAPTMNEGLHIPPAEAMLCNTPVIATNAEMSGTQDYLEDYINGLVSDNNFRSFLNKIEEVISNRTLLNKLKENTRNKIIELGDRETNMKSLVYKLNKILGKLQ